MVEHQTDLQLVQAIGAGDAAAFERFFSSYFPRVYRFIAARVRHDTASVEDLTQLTLLRAMRGFARYRGEASLYTWLCQIARNELSDFWKKRQREHKHFSYPEDDASVRAVLESLESDPAEQPEQVQGRLDVARLVQVTLDSLPVHYANALEWKYVHGHTVEEIAVMLGHEPTATQSILARARQAFREAFAALGQNVTLEI